MESFCSNSFVQKKGLLYLYVSDFLQKPLTVTDLWQSRKMRESAEDRNTEISFLSNYALNNTAL